MAKNKAKQKKNKAASKKKADQSPASKSTGNKKSASKSKGSKQSTVPTETRASESLTIFWAVSILILLTTNLLTTFGHFYVAANPDAEKMKLFKSLMLFNGAIVGVISLSVLVILHRIRIVPPPRGLSFIGACLAVAPVLAVLIQQFS